MAHLPARAASAFLASAVLAGAHAESLPAYVTAAVSDPARPADQRQLDRWRKPAQLLVFAGVQPGDRIADFMPGNAYFTRLFSVLVGPQGRVYAFLPEQQLAHCAAEETAGTRALEGDPHYANVQVLTAPADRFAVPESLDLVWTAQNYHDLHDAFMQPLDVAALDRAIFRALKPGGVLLVIDHAAAAGSGLRDTDSLHRIDPASIRAEVTAVGFQLEAQSALLRNPRDSHALPVFEPSIRHRTDQVILRFRKPAS